MKTNKDYNKRQCIIHMTADRDYTIRQKISIAHNNWRRLIKYVIKKQGRYRNYSAVVD